MKTVAAVLAAALTFILGVAVAGQPATADPTVVNDVRYGMFTLLDEMANRSTPTGRQGGDDVDKLINRTVERELQELHDCLTLEAASGIPGNSYCPDTSQ